MSVALQDRPTLIASMTIYSWSTNLYPLTVSLSDCCRRALEVVAPICYQYGRRHWATYLPNLMLSSRSMAEFW